MNQHRYHPIPFKIESLIFNSISNICVIIITAKLLSSLFRGALHLFTPSRPINTFAYRALSATIEIKQWSTPPSRPTTVVATLHHRHVHILYTRYVNLKASTMYEQIYTQCSRGEAQVQGKRVHRGPITSCPSRPTSNTFIVKGVSIIPWQGSTPGCIYPLTT